MTFSQLKDVHTHQAGRPDALLSLPPEKAIAGYVMPYSLQLHPWFITDEAMTDFVQAAEALKEDPNLLAIGECGLDNKCQTPLPVQIEAFKVALQTAKNLHLPVIIHCVGYWAEMMACVDELLGRDYMCPMVVHGFRKGPQLAQQLLKAGFSISLGEHYNEQTRTIIPQERLYWESDEE